VKGGEGKKKKKKKERVTFSCEKRGLTLG